MARNGPEFEKMTMEKQKENPKFSFLFGGDFYGYYKYKLALEQQQREWGPRLGAGRGWRRALYPPPPPPAATASPSPLGPGPRSRFTPPGLALPCRDRFAASSCPLSSR